MVGFEWLIFRFSTIDRNKLLKAQAISLGSLIFLVKVYFTNFVWYLDFPSIRFNNIPYCFKIICRSFYQIIITIFLVLVLLFSRLRSIHYSSRLNGNHLIRILLYDIEVPCISVLYINPFFIQMLLLTW